ncbi:MAG: mannosyl-glycoprotein endo-beta-N-acetylglucosamidase [Clostridiales bacterium]|nr:mannosyl-glycoprotein endo-beta-N-acetylglucosamidase [Clostridiales bacterium]
MVNKKRKRKYNKRKKRNSPKNMKTIIQVRSVLFILVLIVSVIFMSKIFNNNKKFITIENINYYIDLADKYSEGRGQLNWKEIAAIDGGINDNNFEKSNEEVIKKIANSFYEEGSNNKKSFDEALQECTSSKKEKEKVKLILEKLQNTSLRQEVEGENANKDKFIASIKDYAINNYKNYGVLPSITISQAIIESNWGTSELASKYNNYFGVKADRRWKGKIVNFSTKENYKDVINANFRAYNSVEESVNDQGKFLSENSRYRDNGLFSSTSYIGQANALEKAGYATAKDENGEAIYADTLIRVIRENNLMIIDSML